MTAYIILAWFHGYLATFNVVHLATPAAQEVSMGMRMPVIANLFLGYCKRQAQTLFGKQLQGIVHCCKRQSWNRFFQVMENLVGSWGWTVRAQIFQYGKPGTGW